MNRSQIVRDEQHAQFQPFLQFVEKVQNLRLDGDVQRRNRFVGHDERRLRRKGPGDADALPLTAGEFVWIPPPQSRIKAHHLHQLGHPLFVWRLPGRQTRSGSAMIAPAVMRGLREP